MAQNSQLETEIEAPAANKDNLLSMTDTGKEKQVLEINRQMTALESSISALTKKLNSTNKQIKSDVQRLTTSDAEITDKVANTYKQLGIIENSFSQLSEKSTQLITDLEKVNSKIKAFEKSSAKALTQAIDEQSEINNEFKQQHDDIIQRAAKLSKNVKTISTKLTKSIRENNKALTELEARIITELESIAQSSESRDEKLETQIHSSNEEIKSQKARMMLMQSVDEALEKRTAALEETSDKLIQDSQSLRDTTETLDVLTSKLSSDVEALEIHTAQLAEQNIAQQGMIDGLENKTNSIARTLFSLASLERKHFTVLAGTSLLLLLALIGTFFYGQYARDTEQAAEIQRNEIVNEQVTDLQNRVDDEQMASQVFYSDIIDLQKNLTEVQTELKQKTQQLEQVVENQNTQIQHKIQQMTDQVESLNGRVQYLAPLHTFGSDNVIHGSQWLSKLDPEKFSIQIARVADKQELYDTVLRYSNYFTRELAYLKSADNQYILIYGGNFDDQQQVAETLRRLPSFINFQRIKPVSNAEVLKQIKQ